MSYARMDHAAWMQGQMKAENRFYANRKRSRKVVKPLPESLTPFQQRVVDIVGMAGGGIYNAPICSARCINWRYGWDGVSLTWGGNGLATFDRGDLTMLVFLCHEARIRLCIDAVAPGRLRLSFWQRKDKGGYADRHPNIEEAVAAFRAYLPADHRIIYRGEQEEQQR